MRRPAAKPIDALVLLARASAGRRKRQSLVALLVLAGLFLLSGLLFAWWFWPAPPSGQLVLALYDQVALPDVPRSVFARVDPLDATAVDEKLAGCEIWFDQPQVSLLVKGRTDGRGLATAESTFPLSELPLTMTARYAGEKRRQRRGLQAYGRVFVWPADSRLLILDADHALAELEADEFFAAHPLDIRPKSGVLDALRRLRGMYRLVYLTGRGSAVLDYGKLRAWLESSSLPARQFPDGAILTSARAEAADPDAIRQAVLSDLKSLYREKVIGVTTSAEVGRRFHEEGLETYLLGKGVEAPAGITIVADWKDLDGRRLSR